MSYHLTYNVTPHPDGIERDDIPTGDGACDAMVVVSIIEGDDAVSRKFMGIDGKRERELTPEEYFGSWAVWANLLAEQLPVGSWQQRVAAFADDAIREEVLSRRGLVP